MDSIFGLEFQLPGVRSHAKLLSSKVLTLVDVISLSHKLYGAEITIEEIGANLPFLRQ